MRAPLGSESNATGRRHKDESRVLVASVIQGIQASRDEWVVKRADRKQTCSEHAVRKPERRQQQEQVHFRNSELEVLPAGTQFPALHRSYSLLAKGVRKLIAPEDSAPIDPRSKVRRNRHVRRCRHYATGNVRLLTADLIQNVAERSLR